MRYYDPRPISLIGVIIVALFAWKCLFMLAQLTMLVPPATPDPCDVFPCT